MTGSDSPNSTAVTSSPSRAGQSVARRNESYLVLLAIVLWGAAATLHLGRDLWMKRLAADYEDVVIFDCTLWNRVGHSAEWKENPVIARQVDETLMAAPAPSKIQSTIHWVNLQGVVYYETTGIYGVDRKTGLNVANYGSRQRHGQFVFPLRTQKTDYTLWDAFYIGPRQAKFSHTEQIGPIEAYVFQCWVTGLDETDGYHYIDEVPERYRAVSEGSGKVWIDPISGVMLDFYDGGKSSFIDRKTGHPEEVFLYWSSVFSSATKAAHLKLALETRQRMGLLEHWIPIGLFLTGAIVLVLRSAWISRAGLAS